MIESVFLSEAQLLVDELRHRRVKTGVFSSVREELWARAEIYPVQRNAVLELSEEQRAALALFRSAAVG